MSTSTVYRKLDQFTFKEHYDKLPAVMSWDEFGFKKGELAFVAQNYETNQLITIPDNRRQTTIRNYFLKYPLKARQKVQFITMDMSGAYIPLARRLFQKDSRKLSLNSFYSKTFRQTLSPHEIIEKTLDFSE